MKMFRSRSVRDCNPFSKTKRVSVRVFAVLLVALSLASLVLQRTLLLKSSAYNFLDLTSPKIENQSHASLSINDEGDSTAACKLPELDPFHPSVIKFIKDLGKLHCEGANFSKFENNVLRIEGGDVVSAQYRKIERTPGDDFGVVLSDAVRVQDKTRNNSGFTGIASDIPLFVHQTSHKK